MEASHDGSSARLTLERVAQCERGPVLVRGGGLSDQGITTKGRAEPMRILVKAAAEVGEGPVYDPRSRELVWVDIPAGALHRSSLSDGETSTWHIPTQLGAAIPRGAGLGYAVAVREGFGYVIDGALKIADPVIAGRDLLMNDAKCDARGRMWAGSMHPNEAEGHGSLHMWTGDGPSQVVWAGLTLPNGIGWSPDSRRMYFVDSLARSVHVADYDLDRGQPGVFEVFASIEDGLPDGLAVDVKGEVWVAMWDGYRVCRFDASGRLTRTLDVPVARPTSCAFIGGGRLAITTARSDEPGSGSVYVADVGTDGVPVALFRR